MILSVLLVINLIALYSFIVVKKNLHLFEIIVCWMGLTFLRQDFNAVVWLNLGLVSSSHRLDLYWGVFINRILIFTLLQVWMLNEYCVARTWLKKVMLVAGCVALLVGAEVLTEHYGMIQYVHWKIWWSALYWIASLFIGLLILKGFRKLFYAEVRC